MTCTPGKDAAAAFVRVTSELPALVLYLDPVNMAIQLPSSPDGAHVLAKFCRELAREAAKLADELDPAGVRTRHRLSRSGNSLSLRPMQMARPESLLAKGVAGK